MNALPSLWSKATGITAHDSIYCDSARDACMKIPALLPGMNVNKRSFKKKDQAITMDAEGLIKLKDS